jgi:hypothetical protein
MEIMELSSEEHAIEAAKGNIAKAMKDLPPSKQQGVLADALVATASGSGTLPDKVVTALRLLLEADETNRKSAGMAEGQVADDRSTSVNTVDTKNALSCELAQATREQGFGYLHGAFPTPGSSEGPQDSSDGFFQGNQVTVDNMGFRVGGNYFMPTSQRMSQWSFPLGKRVQKAGNISVVVEDFSGTSNGQSIEFQGKKLPDKMTAVRLFIPTKSTRPGSFIEAAVAVPEGLGTRMSEYFTGPNGGQNASDWFNELYPNVWEQKRMEPHAANTLLYFNATANNPGRLEQPLTPPVNPKTK